MKPGTKSIVLVTLLSLLVIILKAFGVLNISWLLATLLLWLPTAVLVACVAGGFLGFIAVSAYAGFWGFFGKIVGSFFSK